MKQILIVLAIILLPSLLSAQQVENNYVFKAHDTTLTSMPYIAQILLGRNSKEIDMLGTINRKYHMSLGDSVKSSGIFTMNLTLGLDSIKQNYYKEIYFEDRDFYIGSKSIFYSSSDTDNTLITIWYRWQDLQYAVLEGAYPYIMKFDKSGMFKSSFVDTVSARKNLSSKAFTQPILLNPDYSFYVPDLHNDSIYDFLYINKFDKDGHYLFQKEILLCDSITEDSIYWIHSAPNSIISDSIGNIYLSCYYSKERQSDYSYTYYLQIYKLNKDLELQWSHVYRDFADDSSSLYSRNFQLNKSGELDNLVMTDKHGLYVFRLDTANGEVLKILHNTNLPNDEIVDSYITSDNSYITCGKTYIKGDTVDGSNYTNCRAIKLNSNFEEEWSVESIFPNQYLDQYTKLYDCGNNEYMFFGSTRSLAFDRIIITKVRDTKTGVEIEGENKVSINAYCDKNYLTVRTNLDYSDFLSYKLFDLKGDIVFTAQNELASIGENLKKIDISNLAKGCYIIQVQSGKYSINKKVIID